MASDRSSSKGETFSRFYLIFSLLSQLSAAFLQSPNITGNSFVFPISTTNLTTVEVEYNPPQFFANGTVLNHAVYPRRRKVAYYEADGLAIIDGDVIFGTMDDLRAAMIGSGKVRPRALSIFQSNTLSKWPNAELRYKWESEETKSKRKEGWDAAVKLWKDRLPWLYFIENEAPSATRDPTGAVVTLRDKFTGPDACERCSYSWVGRAIGVKSATPVDNTIVLGDCDNVEQCSGPYAHEIGHSLGLDHEHQRFDRDDNVVLHCDVVDFGKDKNGVPLTGNCDGDETSCTGVGCAFAKVVRANWDGSGPYDRNSLMHYPSTFTGGPPFLFTGRFPFPDPNPTGKPTITDAQRICHIYHENCLNICGDGILSPGEQCDDGNNADGDGCSSDCKLEPGPPFCGNGRVESGEQCDNGPTNGVPGDSCTSTCQFVTSVPPGPGPGPGANGACEITECDPTAGKNLCDVTTSCILIDGAPKTRHLCACAHGFRGTAAAGAKIGQIRIPVPDWPSQKGRVFVEPGTVCSTLCDAWTLGADGCTEVAENNKCFTG